MRYLIVNADDFGRFAGISQGIIDAHLRGIVTSTTVMINCEDAPASLDKALREVPELRMGVHLNLTYGKPLSHPSRIPTLINDENLFRKPIEAEYFFQGWHEDDLHTELTAQIEHFIRITGFVPTHLDAHYHSALLFPNALKVVLNLAEKYDIPIRRPPVVEPFKKASAILFQCFPHIELGMAREIITESKCILMENDRVDWPSYLELGFSRPNITLENLQAILSLLHQGTTELVCHPGYVDTVLCTPYQVERESEISILSNTRIMEQIAEKNIKLISFDSLRMIDER